MYLLTKKFDFLLCLFVFNLLDVNVFSEYNTWEPAEVVGQCKELLDEFEKNLAKQKEMKAAGQVQNTVKTSTPTRVYMQKTVVKADNSVKPGPSSAAQAG